MNSLLPGLCRAEGLDADEGIQLFGSGVLEEECTQKLQDGRGLELGSPGLKLPSFCRDWKRETSFQKHQDWTMHLPVTELKTSTSIHPAFHLSIFKLFKIGSWVQLRLG
ncbi:hypothetical protein XENOCAPTIV_008084 [Xenoophorus captivus]|uniref:Uncharacterized protein n=1 Tax=Xenoophorus captivus TaxID=1517983 RepID=A0ABV0RG65_9TELE